MTDEELLHIIALMEIRGIGSIYARHLIQEFGSAKAVFEVDRKIFCTLPRIGQILIENLGRKDIFENAEKEIKFITEHHIQTLVYGQPDYPHRLSDCPDAPTLLFYMGNANLDSRHIVSIVGTRSCTQYGRDIVKDFVDELVQILPQTLIVSGLALGIDVAAHKAALSAHCPTVGVVAHGLDRIYPQAHRNIAKQMINDGGGLITEYTTGTEPERGNFIARNRIIAGLADATIVAESSDKGGAIVTASIAENYNRDVFSFPGRINDERSKGCNRLIRQNKAALITSAADFVEMMNWSNPDLTQTERQQKITFANVTPLAGQILQIIKEKGEAQMHTLVQTTGQEIATLTEELLDMEMNDLIRTYPGGVYRLK